MLIDAFSYFTWLHTLKLKSEVLQTFIHLKNMVENQFSTNIKVLQMDGGGELCSLSSTFLSYGIIYHFYCSYTQQKNGNVERKNRHVVEVGLSLFAFHIVVYLIDRLPTPCLNHPSYFKLFHKLLDYKLLRSFGCTYFLFLRPFNDNKLQYKSRECVFLRYTTFYKAYLCLDLSSGCL